MKISVTRSGGVAGLTRTWVVNVDEQPDPDDWRALVSAMPWNSRAPQPRHPDRYVYSIRWSRYRMVLSETDLGQWKSLIDRVREQGEPEHGSPSN